MQREEKELLEYMDGLTSIVEEETESVISEMTKLNVDDDYEKIIEYLTDSSSSLSLSFILKRQISVVYKTTLHELSDSLDIQINELTENKNIPWCVDTEKESILISKIADPLTKVINDETGITLDSKEVKKWLNDEQGVGKRSNALKVALAFQMDSTAVTKFLLSLGMSELNLHNPIDYIFSYYIFKKGNNKERMSFEKCVGEYEKGRPASKVVQVSGVEGGTILLQSLLDQATARYEPDAILGISPEELLKVMYDNDSVFTHATVTKKGNVGQYIEGISKTRKENFVKLMKYLYVLYPHHYYEENDSYAQKEIISIDGVPDVGALQKSMFQRRIWMPSKGFYREDDFEGKVMSHNILTKHPGFDADSRIVKLMKGPLGQVFDFLTGYNDRIRKINSAYVDVSDKRASKDKLNANNSSKEAATAISFERADAILMAYLFISAYLDESTNEDTRDRVKDMLSPEESDFDFYIDQVMTQLDIVLSGDEKTRPHYQIINSVNFFLSAFDFQSLYYPLLFDRFFLVAILAEQNGKGNFLEMFF